MYKDFLKELPGVMAKDSSLTDNKIIAETEQRLKLLETEKGLKDDLIRKKNVLNYWLTGSIIILALFLGVVRCLKCFSCGVGNGRTQRKPRPNVPNVQISNLISHTYILAMA